MKPIPIPGYPQDGTRNPARGGYRGPSTPGKPEPGRPGSEGGYTDRGYRGSRPSSEYDDYRSSGEKPRRPEYRRPESERYPEERRESYSSRPEYERPPKRPPEYERPRPYSQRGEREYGETPYRPKPPTTGRYEETSTGYTRPTRPAAYGEHHPDPEERYERERYEGRPRPKPKPKPEPYGKPDPCQEGSPEPGGHGEHGHPAGHGQHGGHEEMGKAPPGVVRQNQKNLTSEARKALLRRIKDFIASDEDPVGYHRENGHVHGTPNFLPWHRLFLQRFEEWQLSRLRNFSDFIPLAFWDPNDPVPVEFRQPDINPDPGLPDLWRELETAGAIEALSYSEFSGIVEEHHNAAHDALGGDMADPTVSPRAPVFWILHAFYDHVFHTWEQAQEEAAA